MLYGFLKLFQGLQVFFWTLSWEQRPDEQMGCDCTALLGASDIRTKAQSNTRAFNLDQMAVRRKETSERTWRWDVDECLVCRNGYH